MHAFGSLGRGPRFARGAFIDLLPGDPAGTLSRLSARRAHPRSPTVYFPHPISATIPDRWWVVQISFRTRRYSHTGHAQVMVASDGEIGV